MIKNYEKFIEKMEKISNIIFFIPINSIYQPLHKSTVDKIINKLVEIKSEYERKSISQENYEKLKLRYIRTITQNCGSLRDEDIFWQTFKRFKQHGILLEEDKEWYIKQSPLGRWY